MEQTYNFPKEEIQPKILATTPAETTTTPAEAATTPAEAVVALIATAIAPTTQVVDTCPKMTSLAH